MGAKQLIGKIKTWPALAIVFLWVLLTCPLLLMANSLCHKAFQSKSVKLVKYSQAAWPSRHQCEGTCYFEARLAVLEQALSMQLGKPVSISRPYALSYILQERVVEELEKPNRTSVRTGIPPAQLKDPTAIDFISGGRSYDLTDALLRGQLLVRSRDSIKAESKITSLENIQIENLLLKANLALLKNLNSSSNLQGRRADLKSVFEASRWSYELSYESLPAQSYFSVVQSSNLELDVLAAYEDYDLKLAREEVDSDRVVFLSYHKNLKEGAVDLDTVENSYVLSGDKIDTLSKQKNGWVHAVAIVGYRTDPSGSISDLVIRDSHSQALDPKGHYFMPVSLFENRVSDVEVPRQ